MRTWLTDLRENWTCNLGVVLCVILPWIVLYQGATKWARTLNSNFQRVQSDLIRLNAITKEHQLLLDRMLEQQQKEVADGSL